ncbi:hypothetical protein L1D54_06065 [Vibrio brasiliensis]|jgi:hypothetical protein|uniref:hypothetical protein n=1 Tax=Vibrio brasiliensis TaxID=170652 RepID=UPI001EFD8C3C|nr:hypothetical protein [Vibrio brasiliensis]MCG9750036.1 hypothetical protein [Vibrio brasiliensis]MCG9784720.1 hypothetical protein [Vibrio brasiliensis]
MCNDRHITEQNVIKLPTRGKEKRLQRCYYCTESGSKSCQSCQPIAYLVETYIYHQQGEKAQTPSVEELTEAIWSLHYAKTRLQHHIQQTPDQLKPDVVESIQKVIDQLAHLNCSLKLLDNHPLSFLLAMLVKDTEMMLRHKATLSGGTLHEV